MDFRDIYQVPDYSAQYWGIPGENINVCKLYHLCSPANIGRLHLASSGDTLHEALQKSLLIHRDRLLYSSIVCCSLI